MITKQLKRQHHDIGNILGELQKSIKSPDEVQERALEISLKVSQLAGNLKIHLRSEDDNFYPSLLRSEDQRVREIANKFVKEMGDLGEAFDQYRVKYIRKANIEQEPENFIRDTAQVINAILKRVEKEETELYVLLNGGKTKDKVNTSGTLSLQSL